MFQQVVLSPVTVGDVVARKERFLERLITSGIVSEVCQELNESIRVVTKWRAEDIEFRERWVVALETVLEETAMRRALSGDSAMISFMLKSVNRRKYDDAAARSDMGTGNITIEIVDATKVEKNEGSKDLSPSET